MRYNYLLSLFFLSACASLPQAEPTYRFASEHSEAWRVEISGEVVADVFFGKQGTLAVKSPRGGFMYGRWVQKDNVLTFHFGDPVMSFDFELEWEDEAHVTLKEVGSGEESKMRRVVVFDPAKIKNSLPAPEAEDREKA